MTTEQKYQFIHSERNNHSVRKMAKLFKMSRSSYYSWRSRPVSKRPIERSMILKEIIDIHQGSKHRYGSPKIHNQLNARGIKCGINRVAILMRENNIKAKVVKKFKVTTNSNHNNPIAPNLLNRNFTASRPNEVWVSDITYIHTYEGWLYLCVIIDLFSRKVIGYYYDKQCTQNLVIKALSMAIMNRKPSKELIFHSDRGVQYTCKTVREILKSYKIKQSMSRKGDCWDNAVVESFFHLIKTEEINHCHYLTREAARISVFEYIEIFYNQKRIHSTIGYLTPNEFEEKAKKSA